MAIDYGQSLSRLRSRRLGYDRDFASFAETLTKSERYEQRATTTATKYALGAMQAVDPAYTQVCFDEGNRVAEQIRVGLKEFDRTAYYEFQGSVPLDVHIRGASDVDLLVLHGEWMTFSPAGPSAYLYASKPAPASMLVLVQGLRNDCETILERRNWGAKVDKTGAKAIKLSEGGFKRKIDVVPAHWFDSATYQGSFQKHDREVCILDRSVPTLLSNLPFLHMKRIDEKNTVVGGGAKMAIRLLKNLVADTDKKIELSSYDLAALVWTCPDDLIRFSWLRELSVLVGIDRYLVALASDYTHTISLQTPDGTRKIVDSPAKFSSLVALSAELSALVQSVEGELMPLAKSLGHQVRRRGELLESVQIPA